MVFLTKTHTESKNLTILGSENLKKTGHCFSIWGKSPWQINL